MVDVVVDLSRHLVVSALAVAAIAVTSCERAASANSRDAGPPLRTRWSRHRRGRGNHNRASGQRPRMQRSLRSDRTLVADPSAAVVTPDPIDWRSTRRRACVVGADDRGRCGRPARKSLEGAADTIGQPRGIHAAMDASRRSCLASRRRRVSSGVDRTRDQSADWTDSSSSSSTRPSYSTRWATTEAARAAATRLLQSQPDIEPVLRDGPRGPVGHRRVAPKRAGASGPGRG